MRVAITGATGFVGPRLVAQLQARGDEILVLTRNVERTRRVFPAATFPKVNIAAYKPTESGDWQGLIAGYDGVVNLAGAAIAQERWTEARKREIMDSRKLGTAKIVEAILAANPKPKVLVNSSAIGYYGTSETAAFDEASPPGGDFLAAVCREWEAQAQKVTGPRLAIVRTGIVLGKEGGALAKMIPAFQLFAGGPIGSGRQWFSWIHRDDLVALIIRALDDAQFQGIFNAVAPNPVRMGEFCKTLGAVMNRPSWMPVPEFVPQLLLGEGAKVVTEGQQVFPKRTLALGFEYQYPTLKPALTQIFSSR
ncbi:MAG TPA: TIGR01777 family protein [Oscillatoriaceae cyanobacterium M33_DOE_052]|uniref:TIGR01777 family protein n=1 Tax=Planktothricoides sp. SpSt-374 TaxID=2282167 RepID=A0A7C3ZYL3_9CYAN|nr:TIGR01777 family protein [Oscillatoriaceae cyanobacterium M33_DOE_052]